MHQVKYVRWVAFLLVLGVTTAGVIPAQAAPFGSRLKKMSWFGGGSDDAGSNTGASPRVATRQSQPTFAPSPLAPKPSVTMPATTSPTGDLPTAQRNDKPGIGGRFWSAVGSTRKALTIKPRTSSNPDPIRLDTPVRDLEAPVFVSAARVYEAQGKLAEARDYYQKALAVDAKNLDALVGMARLKHREGDLVAATEMYQRALQTHPNNPVILNDLGLCYARREMLQQAQQSLEQAVAQDRSSKLYRNNLALVLVEMNRTDQAFAQLQEVHGESVAHYNLAYLLREKGQHDAAADHLRAALQADPRMEPARVMLAQLNPPAMANPSQGIAHDPRQGGGRLGAPQIERQQPTPYAAPVVNQQPQPGNYQGRQLPVSHRQDEPFNNSRIEGSQYPGANYGAPNQGPPSRQPANVGPVRVRFENGEPADYRGGAASTGPSNPAPLNPAPRFPQANAPVGQPETQQQPYDTRYREAPLPDAAPDYLSRPQQPAAPPSGASGSRWTTP